MNPNQVRLNPIDNTNVQSPQSESATDSLPPNAQPRWLNSVSVYLPGVAGVGGKWPWYTLCSYLLDALVPLKIHIVLDVLQHITDPTLQIELYEAVLLADSYHAQDKEEAVLLSCRDYGKCGGVLSLGGYRSYSWESIYINLCWAFIINADLLIAHVFLDKDCEPTVRLNLAESLVISEAVLVQTQDMATDPARTKRFLRLATAARADLVNAEVAGARYAAGATARIATKSRAGDRSPKSLRSRSDK
jgi:hypothetical protein